MEKKILNTWSALKCEKKDDEISVSVWGREYKIENNILFSSVNVLGEELLNGPIRIIAEENLKNEEVKWQEIDNFIFEKNDEKAVICGGMRGEYITLNATSTIEFDGYTSISLKVLPRTYTIAEENMYGRQKEDRWSVDKLWIEIPLKKKHGKNFHYFPNAEEKDAPIFEGKAIPFNRVASSREIPSSMSMPFKPLLWVGDETRGFCFAADSNKNWQPEDKQRAVDIIDKEDEVVIRLRLLESVPVSWFDEKGEPLCWAAKPVSFNFSFQVTPFKEFPQNPYKEKIMHIDCFNGKILGEYNDFLRDEYVKGSGENCYDRMKRLGVTTLIIHEKWNLVQNYWVISEENEMRTREIVDECHKRGIKVIPYFGYEISSLSPLWDEYAYKSALMSDEHKLKLYSWYRKPNQQAIHICPASDFTDIWVEGVKGVIEKFDFDGLYVDGYVGPFGCCNKEHGCGFYDHTGEYCPTYSVTATREWTKKIYAFLEERGGIFNSHLSSCCNIPAFSFCHLQWDGEDVQWHIKEFGDKPIEYLTPDYMRTEYIGRNFGLNFEFIGYTFDNWSFEDSMTVALPHGVLPRPNVLGKPLELMSPIWKAIDDFDVTDAKFVPYWENNIDCGADKTKITYYEKENKRLAFIANMSNTDNDNINLNFSSTQVIIDALTGEEIKMPMCLKACKHRVLLISDK